MDRARRAYAPTTSPILTGRDAELQLFSQITAKLAAAAATPQDLPRLAMALLENRRVWAHLAAEVADQTNALPADLRGRIFHLFECVTLHSRRVLRGQADASVLIDINTAIMRGLNRAEAPR
ncbi:flagellar biosynthesis regulatory protein FlaF [Histidinibacterium lentulum]|uniref:Flagellar biosynthesis regulatory protein FlaF n=1 Tax=Histidinibacterium lentulum TaxID=2480588 RepID=A0A3N2R769_9RHOB|nr:flagellar biosynthesis regulatory protein FlaF [Histidinibacterium lentulum]